MTKIGKSAFVSCNDLKSITLNSMVKSIGKKAIGFDLESGNKYSKIDNVIIYTPISSSNAAYKYAKKNGITVVGITAKLKSIKLESSSVEYTGKAIKPSITVKDSYGNTVKKKFYKVTFKNNKAVGKATIIVEGKDPYTGTISKTFKIVPKKTTLSSVNSKKSKQIVVKWKKNTSGSGYEIQYSSNKKFTSGTTKVVTISKNKTTSKTIKNLQSGKKYYVRVRSYKKVSGTKYYGAWSSVKIIEV
ncbi:MAG: fibronectin type III domain-containing protein [Lachnospiraceae bacterium]|nr:fibronectin type III domain-containing protein [Lachnospiraceae bacterium]